MKNNLVDQTEEIRIRHAQIKDFGKVQKYLREYWDEGNHIFGKNPEYFKYFQVIDEKFNVYIGEGQKSKRIYGICAYVLCNKLEKKDIQLNLLHVRKNNNEFNSIQLLDYMNRDLGCRIFSACGIRANTKVIYDFLGYHTGKLDHYYRLADKKNYQIAIVKDKQIPKIIGDKYKLKLLPTFERLKECFNISKYKDMKPYKDEWCIEHRYYKHMGRRYQVYGIDKGKRIFDSIIICREVSHNDTKICKIIDFIGIDEDISGLSNEFEQMICNNDYEYLDFYCTGISNEILTKAGFKLRTPGDANIIPQLFEPFVQDNKDIFFFTNNIEGFHMYRGDSDQDRVNISLK